MLSTKTTDQQTRISQRIMFCIYIDRLSPSWGSVLFTVTSTRELVPPGRGEILPWTNATDEPPPAMQAAIPSFVATISSTLCNPARSHNAMNWDSVLELVEDGTLMGCVDGHWPQRSPNCGVVIVRGATGAPPNSNLAESSASVVESVGSGAESPKPSSRPAAATGFVAHTTVSKLEARGSGQ